MDGKKTKGLLWLQPSCKKVDFLNSMCKKVKFDDLCPSQHTDPIDFTVTY